MKCREWKPITNKLSIDAEYLYTIQYGDVSLFFSAFVGLLVLSALPVMANACNHLHKQYTKVHTYDINNFILLRAPNPSCWMMNTHI